MLSNSSISVNLNIDYLEVQVYYDEIMDNLIECPNCKIKFELTDVLKHQIEEKIRNEEKTKYKAQFEKEKQEEIAEKVKKAQADAEAKNKQKDKELENVNKKKEELENILAANKKDQDKLIEKITVTANTEAQKEFGFKLKEKDKQLEDAREAARKANEELKRKLNQGSQQLQGDVLEQDLEDRLRVAFPNDLFKPVPTGVRGGDIIQEVRNKHGNSAGLILWEAKRTKTWQKDWLTKLKDDMRNIKASDCILVSDVLPPEIKVYDRIENVWVTSYEYALNLAFVVRIGLLNVAIARSSASHTDEQLKELYDVITSDSFRQMFEARDEIINALKIELEADKRSAEKRWGRQGAYIEKLDRNNSRLYGELQAHIPSLKPLKEIEMLKIGESNEQESLI
jgi:hypothetical protein